MLPCVFLNTATCQRAGEEKDPESESWGNCEEVGIAWGHCRMLLAAGVLAADISILSPYRFQVGGCPSDLLLQIDCKSFWLEG